MLSAGSFPGPAGAMGTSLGMWLPQELVGRHLLLSAPDHRAWMVQMGCLPGRSCPWAWPGTCWGGQGG